MPTTRAAAAAGIEDQTMDEAFRMAASGGVNSSPPGNTARFDLEQALKDFGVYQRTRAMHTPEGGTSRAAEVPQSAPARVSDLRVNLAESETMQEIKLLHYRHMM